MTTDDYCPSHPNDGAEGHRYYSATIDDYRLTIADEERIIDRLAATIAGWKQQSPTRTAPRDAATRDALVMIAAHAIGCSRLDLRNSELTWIDNEIGEQLDDI